MQVYTSLTQLIGNTPLLELTGIQARYELKAKLIAKLEYFNPLGSIKDRAAHAMIEAGIREGKIDGETVIIESTSGNTGVGLAFVCAAKGNRLILTMPETMSAERRMLLTALGAEIHLTRGSAGMKGAIERAEELHREIPNSFMPMQFENRANADIHRHTTAEEIWRDLEGQVDVLVCTFGTGGTITGTGEALKAKKPAIRVVGVEPTTSAVVSGGRPGPHKIQGIGPGFVPAILNTAMMDEVLPVSSEDAMARTAELSATEGLLVGISSGAALEAAIQVARRPENEGKNIVLILPDTGERYLSTGVFGRMETAK